MTIIDIIKTILLGMAIAAPVGPISLVCIRTTLGSGFASGLSAGLGSALADGLVCLAALTSIKIISASPLFSGPILNYIAAAYLIYMGSRMIWRGRKCQLMEKEANSSAKRSFVSTFVITVVNPLTLLSFAALFCGSQNTDNSIYSVLTTATCIFLGSSIWWLILAGFLSLARRSLGNTAMKAINFGSAFCILAFGLKLIFV